MNEFSLQINNRMYRVKIRKFTGDNVIVDVDDNTFEVAVDLSDTPKQKIVQREVHIEGDQPKRLGSLDKTGRTTILAPLPGVAIRYEVNVGDSVKQGQTLIILEAMKMENDIPSTIEGTVAEILVNPGDNVREGDALVIIDGKVS